MGGRIRAASPGEFFLEGAWQYGCAVSAASRKSGKPLGEHSGLLLTVTCLGIGKGWSANIALGW